MMSRAGKSRGPSRTDVSAFDVLFVRKWSVWGRYVLVEYLGRESCMELAMCWSTGKLELAHLWSFLSSSLCVTASVMVPASPSSSASACPFLVTLVGLVSQHCSQEQGEHVALHIAPAIQLRTATSFHQTKIKLVKGDGDRALKC